jgi:hypothetical protein
MTSEERFPKFEPSSRARCALAAVGVVWPVDGVFEKPVLLLGVVCPEVVGDVVGVFPVVVLLVV